MSDYPFADSRPGTRMIPVYDKRVHRIKDGIFYLYPKYAVYKKINDEVIWFGKYYLGLKFLGTAYGDESIFEEQIYTLKEGAVEILKGKAKIF